MKSLICTFDILANTSAQTCTYDTYYPCTVVYRYECTGRDRDSTAGKPGCSLGCCKEAKDVGEWKRKYREETLLGDEDRDQEVQARCFQEKA